MSWRTSRPPYHARCSKYFWSITAVARQAILTGMASETLTV